MNRIITHPSEIEWIDGELPDVHMVPKDCCVLVWFVTDVPPNHYVSVRVFWPEFNPDRHNGRLRRIELCQPKEDNLNPLKWCDSSGHPIGHEERVTHWAWICKGIPLEQPQPWSQTGF